MVQSFRCFGFLLFAAYRWCWKWGAVMKVFYFNTLTAWLRLRFWLNSSLPTQIIWQNTHFTCRFNNILTFITTFWVPLETCLFVLCFCVCCCESLRRVSVFDGQRMCCGTGCLHFLVSRLEAAVHWALSATVVTCRCQLHFSDRQTQAPEEDRRDMCFIYIIGLWQAGNTTLVNNNLSN